MKASVCCRRLIEEFEGFVPHAYQDQRGIWTIGFGHTSGVRPGDVCTLGQADEWLAQDMAIAESAVNGKHLALTQNQFDALVSLVFNIGAHAFEHSTVLADLKALQYTAAAAAILLWNKTKGEVNPGLERRRKAERGLFLSAPRT